MASWKANSVPGNPLVGLVVATYQQGPQLRALSGCLQSQTHRNFVALAVHDGPDTTGSKAGWPAEETDARFRWLETETRENKYGHPGRRLGFAELLKLGAAYLGTTNGDNLYTPVYFERMLSLAVREKAEFVYCDFVLSHRNWAPVDAKIERRYIDAGGWLVSARAARRVVWDSYEFAGDWDYISRVREVVDKVVKLPETHFFHN